MTDELIIEKLKMLLFMKDNGCGCGFVDTPTLIATVELIEKLKAENADLKKHPHCPPCDDFFCYSEKLKEHDKEIMNDAINLYKKIVFEKISATEASLKGNRHCVYACDSIRRQLSNIEIII